MKSRTLVVLLAAGLALASCAKEKQDGDGRLRLQFSVDPAVTEHKTRALSLEAPGASEFSLRLTNSDPKIYDKPWGSMSDFPAAGVYVKAGIYTATASYGDIKEEGFGKPAFEASETFNISDGVTKLQTLEAKLVNMAVTVSYTEAFRKYFPERYAVITTSAGNEISFQDTDEETNSDKTAYINPENFKITVYYKRQSGSDGEAVFQINNTTYKDKGNKLIEPVGPRKWANITIDVNGETGGVGGAGIEIIFDDEVDDEGRDIEAGEDKEVKP